MAYENRTTDGRGMSAVRLFAVVAGAVYVLVGLLGFVPGALQDPAPHDPALAGGFASMYYGRLLGLFPVNILHNLVHILIGVWGLLSFRTHRGAIGYARGLAVIYLLLAVLGAIPVEMIHTTFRLIPIHSHDVWLHAATGLVAAFLAMSSRRDDVVTTTDPTGTTPRSTV